MNIQIDITGERIETGRLILRPWFESDLNDFFEYASVEGVGEMAGWKHHETIEVTKEILQSFISEKDIFAVALKESDKVIGSLGLHYSWANDDPETKNFKLKEIGFALSKNFWGKGLMPEAVSEVIRYCFFKCGLDALTVGHFSTNYQSKRVIEKCGFQFANQSECYAKQLQKRFIDMRYILFRNSSLQSAYEHNRRPKT